MDLIERTTRDLDNDGVMDIYGICGFHVDTLEAALPSNGAAYVRRDENGRFYNASLTPEFREAADFVHSWAAKGLVKPNPEGANWDWFIEGFNEGTSAFRVTEEYAKSQLEDVTFDWGFVFFPRGPRMDRLVSAYHENVLFLPVNGYTDQELDNIIFAFGLWNEPTPGWEDDTEVWKYDFYQRYRDSRAVDETLAMMRKLEHNYLKLHPFILNLETGNVAYNIWSMESTPIELIEATREEWDYRISEVNRIVFGDE